MCNIQVNPKATAETIAKAFAKAADQGANYELRFHVETDERNNWYGISQIKTGARYIVQTNDPRNLAISCNCPEFERNHFCKHCALVVEDQQIREQEEIYSSIDGNVPEYKF
jgi:hypothetical protein